jgi:hypothetical protein
LLREVRPVIIREAFVTRGVKLTPIFTGPSALAMLLLLVSLAWWREGREPSVASPQAKVHSRFH